MVFCDDGACDCGEGVMDLRLISPYDIQSVGVAVGHLCDISICNQCVQQCICV